MWDNIYMNWNGHPMEIDRLRHAVTKEGGASAWSPITMAIHGELHPPLSRSGVDGSWLATVMQWAEVKNASAKRIDILTREIISEQTAEYPTNDAARKLNRAAFSFKNLDWKEST